MIHLMIPDQAMPEFSVLFQYFVVFRFVTKLMDHSHARNDASCCRNTAGTRSVHQSLDEMDFDRGVWSAALYGDLEKVQKLLHRDPHCVTKEDTSGYTALVSTCELHIISL